MNQLGNHAQERHDRTLYLTHQLQEGGHHTKGDQPVLELNGAIDKGSEIAITEGEGKEQTGYQRKTDTTADQMMQTLLHAAYPTGNRAFCLQGLDGEFMFYRLLNHHLYAALLLAYRQRHLLESAAEILGTDCNHRCQHQKTPCQNGIDGTHQEESTEELHQGDYDCGQDIRNYRRG